MTVLNRVNVGVMVPLIAASTIKSERRAHCMTRISMAEVS